MTANTTPALLLTKAVYFSIFEVGLVAATEIDRWPPFGKKTPDEAANFEWQLEKGGEASDTLC
jgi:hypothetical protein